jgi:hypothetical protein
MNNWTPKEITALREAYTAGGIEAARQALPGRTAKAIHNKASEHGMQVLRRWTEEQDQAIRTYYDSLGAAAVGKMIGRSVQGVRVRASKLGIVANLSKVARRRMGGKGLSESSYKAPRRPAHAPMAGEARITSETRVTIAPPFVDKRFTPTGPVRRVVDSSQCRAWAQGV